MSDNILITTDDGRIETYRPKEGPVKAGDRLDEGGKEGRTVKDVIHLSAGLDRAGTLKDLPEDDLHTALEEGRREIEANADKFGALLRGGAARPRNPFSRVYDALRDVVLDILKSGKPADVEARLAEKLKADDDQSPGQA